MSTTAADFLSGASGTVIGRRRRSVARLIDAAVDAAAVISGQRGRLRQASEQSPVRSVLAMGIARDGPNRLDAAEAELRSSRHQVQFVRGTVSGRGKFENLNLLLAEHPAAGHDWLVIVDDDVTLPRGFLDAFVFLAEHFDLSLVQPAHRALSHAAWQVTRRRPLTLARQSRLVEIGPVTALRANTFDTLLPFPHLRSGWGLDLHWSALAREQGWREGVIDATAIGHDLRKIAAAYDSDSAVAEARDFLSGRPYLSATEAQQIVATYRQL